jgi:7-keto-8-aminopelargonate synthetase-like enzyme
MAVATVAHKAKVVIVKHNDLSRLETAIQKYTAGSAVNNIWYLCDGVYSMFADVAPIQALIRLLNQYEKFYVYADDAHGMSIRGKHGRGYVLGEQEQLHDKMVVALSLSKCFAMGCGGVLVFPHAEWQRKVRTCGPTMIFSTPIPAPMLGAGIASAQIHLSGEIEELQQQLQGKIHLFRQEAAALGLPLISEPFTPIQYVPIGEFEAAMIAVRSVFDDGFLVNLCGYPAVPKRHCGLRLTISRHVDHDDIRQLALSIRQALERARSPLST